MRLRLHTAGESHGESVTALLKGLPHGVPLGADAIAFIDAELARRQGGHGRGGRMRIEHDTVEIVAGIRHGRSIGAPVLLRVANKDHSIEQLPDVTAPRPGHADLAGALKFGLTDVRDVLERASARETAARVAAGALAQWLLNLLGVQTVGYVERIGPTALAPEHDPARLAPAELTAERLASLIAARNASATYSPDKSTTQAMVAAIDDAMSQGDSLGGRIAVIAVGVPPGLGSHTSWDERLDARLAGPLMSIPAIKAVEIGLGVEVGTLPGSAVHDPIAPAEPESQLPLTRPSNRAGGIEGGISNGMPIVCRVTMKPIPTLRRPLPSVDLRSGEIVDAARQRTDACAVPAASVVVQSQVALVLLDAVLDRFGADTLDTLRERFTREAFRFRPASQ